MLNSECHYFYTFSLYASNLINTLYLSVFSGSVEFVPVSLQYTAAGTCFLLIDIFSLCPLDGKHVPPCEPQQLNSITLCSAQVPSNMVHTATAFKWRRCSVQMMQPNIRAREREVKGVDREWVWRAVSSNDAHYYSVAIFHSVLC